MKVAFIVGSPRSGTTILENILNVHPNIASWYEPYYLWEKFFNVENDDIWSSKDLTKKVHNEIQKEFNKFYLKAGKSVVLDKSPIHSFNISIIHQIFPDARWIHILRDGRDVALSIQKEWEKRREIVQNKNFILLFKTAIAMLKRQPFWKYRFMAISYELKNILSFNVKEYLNKSKWKGNIGWGIRFDGWQNCQKQYSPLEFNAMQWVKSVEAVRSNWRLIPDKNRLEIRYENLLMEPQTTLIKILEFLGYEAESAFFSKIPQLKNDNFNKWKTEFADYEIRQIKSILSPLLDELGYTKRYPW